MTAQEVITPAEAQEILAPVEHLMRLVNTLNPANAFRAGADNALNADSDPYTCRLWFEFAHDLDEFDCDAVDEVYSQRLRLTDMIQRAFGLGDNPGQLSNWWQFDTDGYASNDEFQIDEDRRYHDWNGEVIENDYDDDYDI